VKKGAYGNVEYFAESRFVDRIPGCFDSTDLQASLSSAKW
jgi:hypothetical protein